MEQRLKLKGDKFLIIPFQRVWCFKTFPNLGTIPLLNAGFNLKVLVITWIVKFERLVLDCNDDYAQ
jgi:hypothetical protein